MKNLNYMVFVLGLVASTSSQALDVKATCPLTVKAGTALKVTEKITNTDCKNAVTVSKLVTGAVGNNSGSLGLAGPYVRPLNPTKTVPKASCRTITIPGCTLGPQYCTYTQLLSPGVLNLSVTVLGSTPASLNNTLVLATAGVMNSGGKIDVDACHITVIP